MSRYKRQLGNGFSTVELIVVIAIIGILMAIALPTYMSLVPRSETKSDAQAVKNLMQKARMNASVFQRPIRVLVDCTPDTRQAGTKPCRLEAQVPLFNADGSLKNWSLLPGGRIFLHKGTDITYQSLPSQKKARFDSYSALFENFYSNSGAGPRSYGVYGKDSFNSDSFVVVFTPSGEAISYCPVIMRFDNQGLNGKHNWILNLINSTGHIRLEQKNFVA
jgi:prepilin-type N-terminal cleavage/methylation domain-containing protein